MTSNQTLFDILNLFELVMTLIIRFHPSLSMIVDWITFSYGKEYIHLSDKLKTRNPIETDLLQIHTLKW